MKNTYIRNGLSKRLLLVLAGLFLVCPLVSCSSPFRFGGPLSASPTPTLSHNPAAFQVIRVDISLDPASYHGSCDYTSVSVTVSATIVVPADTPGGTVMYTWKSGNNVPAPPTFVTNFGQGVTTQSVQFFWILGIQPGNDTLHWQEMDVSSPNVLTSPRALFRIFCE